MHREFLMVAQGDEHTEVEQGPAAAVEAGGAGPHRSPHRFGDVVLQRFPVGADAARERRVDVLVAEHLPADGQARIEERGVRIFDGRCREFV